MSFLALGAPAGAATAARLAVRCSAQPSSSSSSASSSSAAPIPAPMTGGKNSSLLLSSMAVPPPSFLLASALTSAATPSSLVDPSGPFVNVLWAAASNSYNTQILVGDTESTESVVRRFKKVCLDANIVNECRRRRYFETKQDIVKRKQKEAARKRKRFQYALTPYPPSPFLVLSNLRLSPREKAGFTGFMKASTCALSNVVQEVLVWPSPSSSASPFPPAPPPQRHSIKAASRGSEALHV